MAKTKAINPASEKIDGIDKWQVENAADALARAEEIKNNPKLCNAAMRVLKSKAEATKEAVMNVGQAMKQAGKDRLAQAGSRKKAKAIYG